MPLLVQLVWGSRLAGFGGDILVATLPPDAGVGKPSNNMWTVDGVGRPEIGDGGKKM